jgi:hypothetical protein
MSLSDLAALGSFVSGLAVLASLGFLYFQMRQMTEQSRQTALNQRSLMLQERTNRTVENIFRQTEPHLRDLVPRAWAGDTSLTDAEITAFLNATYGGLVNFENTFLQHQGGTLDPSIWPVSSTRLADLLGAPGVQAAWIVLRHRFHVAFASEVERMIAAGTGVRTNSANQAQRWREAMAARGAVSITE